MNPPNRPSASPPSSAGIKRAYQPDLESPTSESASSIFGPGGSASAFRNVSACNRCRTRKNRCDQRLPACTACEKAHVDCVGIDPITKRPIPRSYVFFLESRVSYLEEILKSNHIKFKEAQAFDQSSKVDGNGTGLAARDASSDNLKQVPRAGDTTNGAGANGSTQQAESGKDLRNVKEEEAEKLDKLVSNIGMVSVQGASDPRYLGSTSGISFARVVFAAVKSSVSANTSERGSVRPSTNNIATTAGEASMRDSIFGLQTKPPFKQAPFPPRDVADKLVKNYFEYANPQLPILHRGEFMELFHRAYDEPEKYRGPRELYLLNIVCAIGAGIFFESESDSDHENANSSPEAKRRRLSNQQCQPEEYHAAAVTHMETLFGSSPDRSEGGGFGGSLEELQAVLLLAGFALLRPVAPGLWYIVGVAVRLGVDLGLHHEDAPGNDEGNQEESTARPTQAQSRGPDPFQRRGSMAKAMDVKAKGRREWVRDLRRRLWWCAYSLDRLVSVCVGRPFGIADQAITTEFPSLLDDAYISKDGFLNPPPDAPSNKHVTYHYLKLRLLQSEILQVLQHQSAQLMHDHSSQKKKHLFQSLKSPWLENFDGNFFAWRKDIDRRLWDWKESSPTSKQIGVEFSPQFLELNYWQAVIMLYRQSLTVPPPLAAEMTPAGDYASPSMASVESSPEDEDDVFLKVAEAGQKTLRIYRQLHRRRLVNYTYLATHHLFMAGISFLYALWHSPAVRARLTLDDVDFTVLAATSVLEDLMHKCPPAEACRDAFERMSKATVQMCLSTTGFGARAEDYARHTNQGFTKPQPLHSSLAAASVQKFKPPPPPSSNKNKRPPPTFDMGFSDLFPEETGSRLSAQLMAQSRAQARPQTQQLFTPRGPPNYAGSRSRPGLPTSPELTRVKQEYSNNQYPMHPGYSIPADPSSPLQVNQALPPHQRQQQQPQQSPGAPLASPPHMQPPQAPYYYQPVPSEPAEYSQQQGFNTQEFLSMPGLDFLDMGLDMDLGDDPTVMGGLGGGNDIGIGGQDFAHDWSEGLNQEIFEGYFFRKDGQGGQGW